MRSFLFACALALPLTALGCSSNESSEDADDGALTSERATFLDFAFDAEVVAPASVLPRQAIVTQLYYTEGRLTHLGGNTRPGFVRLRDVVSTPAEGGMQKITYKAVLPVLWPANREVPRDYAVAFPRQVDRESLDRFNAKYDGRCGRNEYGQATFWHDFDNGVEGCRLEDDAISRTATIRPSEGATPNLYPEYDKIFTDRLLKVVSIVGLDSFSDQPTDKGVQVFERFVQDAKSFARNATEESRGRDDFVLRQVVVKGELEGGNKYEHIFILVAQAEHANESFDRHFNAATDGADLVTYDGHSGLGKNIAAVTARGTVKAGQYQIWFLDGCNSLGYVDENFMVRRRDTNGAAADPDGTKFLDLIGNALPSYWPFGESTSFKLVRALSNPSAPKSYKEIVDEFPAVQVAAVIGDEDNTYRPR